MKKNLIPAFHYYKLERPQITDIISITHISVLFEKIQICLSLGQSVEINILKQRKCAKKEKKN